MKLPLSMIRSFVSVDSTPMEMADVLCMLGIEVDDIHAPKPPFSGVVVGEVKSCERHPSADKLQVAQVFDGKETVQVVCGAANCRAGLKVAFAKVGAVLPHAKIGKTSIRGIESSGMLCAAEELDLYQDATGILELPQQWKTGDDCLPLLWDPVFEISLTPNLGHCMSALGIARELSASLQLPLEMPKPKSTSGKAPLPVTVENSTLCPRYTACLIQNVQVGPSPFWLQKQLRSAGLHPINNIVDATNYFLLKYGQPLHAFDFDQLEGKTIRVETVKEKTSFRTLTDVEVELPPGTLVIADAKKPVAIAGVMGGLNSAVTEKTKHILLEAACFDPISIRRTSRNVAIRSDSSLRFEKGIDPSAVPHLLLEAAALIASVSGGTIVDGIADVPDVKNREFSAKEILFRPARANQLLGTKLSDNEQYEILARLGFQRKGEKIVVPLFRTDISEEIDLVEEVARIYGYNNIDLPLPRATTPQLPLDLAHLFETELRKRLIALGLQEFLTCDLISPALASTTHRKEHRGFSPIFHEMKPDHLLKTLYSKSEDYSVLRPSLLPGILQVVKHNLAQRNQSFSAFELGRIHFQQEGKPIEYPMAAVVCTGLATPHHWDRKPAPVDFFDLKGLVENLLLSLRIPNGEFAPSQHPTFHPYRQADLVIDGIRVGSLGEIHPEILDKFDIKQKVYYAELNAHHLQAIQHPSPKMRPLPEFPGSERDWTLSLPPKTHISLLLDAIASLKPPLLESFELIDLFQKENSCNATLRFSYRDRSKTLSHEEVERAHLELIQKVLAKTSLSR
jgi:phenylalanyl-tRNA synthetase beta chain